MGKYSGLPSHSIPDEFDKFFSPTDCLSGLDLMIEPTQPPPQRPVKADKEIDDGE